jgi:hypothetical protein
MPGPLRSGLQGLTAAVILSTGDTSLQEGTFRYHFTYAESVSKDGVLFTREGVEGCVDGECEGYEREA